MTLHELLHRRDKAKILEELYKDLKNTGLEPVKEVSLPYGGKKGSRKNALVDRIAEIYDVDKNRAKYKLVPGDFRDWKIEYPFAFEVAAIPLNLSAGVDPGYAHLISGVNLTTLTTSHLRYFQGQHSSTFEFGDKKYRYSASSIMELLDYCGYANDQSVPVSKRRAPALFVVQLIAPRIGWRGGFGKTQLDLEPFAKTISETMSELALRMPTLRGVVGQEDRSKIRLLETTLLRERWEKVKKNPALKFIDPWTQSTVWYNLEPILKTYHVPIGENTRKYITSIIKEICHSLDESHPSREYLGIIASARATMFYRGRWYSVDWNRINELAQKGTDVIFIEKKGVVDQLAHFASKYGIALVNTVGHLTNYAKELIEVASKSAAHVFILTDYDAYGIMIAYTIRSDKIHRIGVDREMLEYLQLSDADVADGGVSQPYKPRENAIKPVRGFARFYEQEGVKKYKHIYDDLSFIEERKIELDSVIAKVGAAKFWEYLERKILQIAPRRNVNRAAEEPDTIEVYPDYFSESLIHLKEIAEYKIKREREKIRAEQADTEGLTDIREKELANKNRLKEILTKDPQMQNIGSKLARSIEGM